MVLLGLICLGLDYGGRRPKDKSINGAVGLMCLGIC